jgi:hypothetical protein
VRTQLAADDSDGASAQGAVAGAGPRRREVTGGGGRCRAATARGHRGDGWERGCRSTAGVAWDFGGGGCRRGRTRKPGRRTCAGEREMASETDSFFGYSQGEKIADRDS